MLWGTQETTLFSLNKKRGICQEQSLTEKSFQVADFLAFLFACSYSIEPEANYTAQKQQSTFPGHTSNVPASSPTAA